MKPIQIAVYEKKILSDVTFTNLFNYDAQTMSVRISAIFKVHVRRKEF